MKGEREDNVEITLTMTGDEAEWLKGVMQNPHGCTPEEEEEYTKKMRQTFFDILHKTIGRIY